MLEINVKITLAAGEEYTATEAAVVAALGGKAPAAAAAAPKAPAAPAPASKPAAATKPPVAKTPAAKTPAKAVEPEPEEEVEDEGPAAALEDEDEDLLGGDEPEYTIEAAVAAATKLVSAGKSTDVKAALAAAGAKKVSELKGKGIQAFIEALEG